MSSSINISKLAQVVADSYNLEELEVFLVDYFKVRLNHIVEPRGSSMIKIVREVIGYFDRRGSLNDLVHEFGRDRPGKMNLLELLVPPNDTQAFLQYTLAMDFIGREQEIALLTKWLVDRDAASIVYIQDALEEKEKKRGIGKTWLLRKSYELVEHQHKNIIPVLVDFINILDRDSVVIAERVVLAVRKRYSHWTAENFYKLLQVYRGAERGQKAEMAILRERLADALVADLHLLQYLLIETDTYLLLFFDTYELIESDPFTAVLQPGKTFPDNYQSNRVRAIIAGRHALDWTYQNWVGREKEVTVFPLPPFNYDETVQYLQARLDVYDIKSLPSQVLQALYQRTEGLPILLGLVTDVLNKRIKDPETLVAIDRSMFEASLVEEINNFDDPSKWVIFSMAHIYHHFNEAFLDRLVNWPGLKGPVPEIQFWEMVKKLRTLSFMRSSGFDEDFVLHDEMRRLVNKYCWETHDQDGRIRRELSKLAVNYYTELIDREENIEKRQSYIVEKLFHELFLDLETGFQSFEQHFNYAIDFSWRAFAHALLQELQKFESRLSHEQRQTMKLAEVRVLREDEEELLQERMEPTPAQRIEENLAPVRKRQDINKNITYTYGSVQGLVNGEHNTVTLNFYGGTERTVPFLAPPLPSYNLVGRDNLLQELKQQLLSGENLALSAINGLPGVGKTALAIALTYDHEVLGHFCDGVLWAGLGREANVFSHLAIWGKALGISQSEMEKLTTISTCTQTLHEAIGTRRMLLVIDDAWSLEEALAFKLGGPHCAHIVTTRLPEVAERFAGEGTVTVRELPEDDSLRLLEQHAPGVSIKAPDEIRAIIQAVDGLPLPLILMGNYLRIQMKTEQPRRLRAALDRLLQVKERLQLEQPQGGLERHPSLPEGIPLSQLAVIKISDEALDQEAQQTLRALSIFPSKPNSFSEEAALAVAATNTEGIDTLLDFGLLESSGPERYTLHQTISDYAQTDLTNTAVYERMVEFFIEYVEAHRTDRRLLERETSNILAAVQIMFAREMQTAFGRGARAFAHFLDILRKTRAF